jgi:hypothetical protein
MMASSYFICCTNLETKLSEHFKVPHSIYVYVKQLECQIYKLKKENCNEGDKVMSQFKAIKIEQFLPDEDKIPDGVISNGLGDPRKILELDWVIDTVRGRKIIYGKDWIAYNADGEKLMIKSRTMREFITNEFDPPPNFEGGW